jgi:hypothetical protein
MFTVVRASVLTISSRTAFNANGPKLTAGAFPYSRRRGRSERRIFSSSLGESW